jgi:hypothetical protein
MRGIFRDPPIVVRSGVRLQLERDISVDILNRERKLLGLEETSVLTSNSNRERKLLGLEEKCCDNLEQLRIRSVVSED